ncbi:stage V sporulation protein D [Jeotgalibacillus campisalis]|uniref:Stage V sporulation protein D n=1 Tax=Jeotgalibacillus campisalis TaxID=220754 RepID=A0A0C2S0Q7_9BACL|nr:stage V sporulation protein D [Jeotgalibacillus campisalis]
MKKITNRTVRKRLALALLLFLAGIVILTGRMFIVQFISHDTLLSKALSSWSRELPMEAERGLIYDRNGEPIVSNKLAPSLFIIPRQIEDRKAAAEMLAEILDMPLEKATAFVERKGSMEKLHPEGRKLSFDQVRKIEEAELKGVYIADDFERQYPNGRSLAHVLGFIGVDNQGLSGLELMHDKMLNGEKGAIELYTDAKGRDMEDMSANYNQPEKGNDLYLTIDQNVQSILERELTNAQIQYDPDQMLAVAMNPKTGEILGMASRPDFHPLTYQEVNPDIYNRILPVWSTYEPGSTFKIITLAAALEEGKVDLEKEQFYDSGSVEIAGTHLHCWKREGHGQQTFLEVVQNSCNPGFIELGNRLGKEKLFEYIHNFGFGDKTGVDLQGEASGILFALDNVGPLELATTAFGQGVSVTPIQQITAVSAAINGGHLPTPHIAKKWVDGETGEVIKEIEPEIKRQVISEETSKKVREALETVVAQGTGRGAYVENYRVGGKTGTAQKVKDGRYMDDSYIVSFIGFAPSDDPELIVYLAIDHPKNTVQFGGVVAAPIVGNILEDGLRTLGVEPRKTQVEKAVRWLDPITYKVPDLIGVTTKELKEMLLPLKLEVEGDGKKVIEQSPKPNVTVNEGSTVRVMMGDGE